MFDIVPDVACGDAELQSPRAVDLDVEVGGVDLLLQMGIDDPRNGGDTAPEFLGNAEVFDPVITDGAHVDLRSKPKIQDLRRHVGGLKIKQIFRERRRQHLSQLAHVIGGWSMAIFKGHHDHAVIDRDRRAVGERPVIRARRHPEIVDDQIEVFLRYDLTDLVLDRLEDLLCHVDAGARRRPDMELDHAAIDRRIEIAADKDEHHAAERENEDGDDRDDERGGSAAS